MRAKHRTFARDLFLEKYFLVLLQRPYLAVALSRGPHERPLCGLVLKLAHGADDQVGFARPYLV
jgi:hypothetical protein